MSIYICINQKHFHVKTLLKISIFYKPHPYFWSNSINEADKNTFVGDSSLYIMQKKPTSLRD